MARQLVVVVEHANAARGDRTECYFETMRGLVPLIVLVLDLDTGEGDLDHIALLDARKELVRAVKRAALNVAARVRHLHFNDGATPFGVAPLVAAHVHDPCNELGLIP